MLSERQRNIVVQLTLAGRTAQYIADRFDWSISTIRQIIKKGIGTLVDSKDCQVVVVQRRPQPVLSAISEGLQSTSDFVHWPKSHRSLLHTVDIQFPKEDPREGPVVRQSTAVLLYKTGY